jgi:hypothetical protein
LVGRNRKGTKQRTAKQIRTNEEERKEEEKKGGKKEQ